MSYTTDVLEEYIKEREAKLGSELAEKEVKLQEYKERLGEYTQHNLELMSDLSDAQTRIKVWKHSAEEKERKLDAIRKVCDEQKGLSFLRPRIRRILDK